MRKVITLTAQWCDDLGMGGWRQHKYNVNHVKRMMRTAQNKKRSKARSPEQIEKNQALVTQAHQDYLVVAQTYLDKARQTLLTIEKQGISNVLDLVAKAEIECFMAHADRQIDQIRRRVILGEVIPHEEKVFSIY